jgi:hypothetical protein
MERKWYHINFTNTAVPLIKEIIENENIIFLQEHYVILPSFRPCYNSYPYGFEINTYNRFMEQFSKKDFFDKTRLNLGLQNGLAGFGMALMTKIKGDDSWISLLPNNLNLIKDESLSV